MVLWFPLRGSLGSIEKVWLIPYTEPARLLEHGALGRRLDRRLKQVTDIGQNSPFHIAKGAS